MRHAILASFLATGAIAASFWIGTSFQNASYAPVSRDLALLACGWKQFEDGSIASETDDVARYLCMERVSPGITKYGR